MVEAPDRVTAEDGSRYYIWTDPETGREEQFWSVTTALSVKAKEGLKFWSAQLSSRRAMANLPKLIASMRVDPCGRARARTEPFGCKQCPDCMSVWLELFHIGESERRKHEGSAIHDALEAWIKTGKIPPVAHLIQPYVERHPGIAEMLPPYLLRLQQWIGDYALEPGDFVASEMKVFSTVHRYGGTLDFILHLKARNAKSAKMVVRILGRPGVDCMVVGDAKTREGEGKELYDEHALQMAPYRHANLCRPSKVDTTLFPMPATHGAVVFQPRPDGYTFEPVVTDENVFRTFLNYLSAFQWKVEYSAASIRVNSFPVPEGFDPKKAPMWGAPPADPDPAPMPASPEAPPAKAAPRKRAAAKKTAAPATRAASATLASINGTGGQSRVAGNTLRDEDIPF